MFVDKIRVPQLRVALGLLGVFTIVVAALSCSEHRFTPVADVEVYPAVLEYEVQNAAEYDKTVVITNKSVSAKLDIYELEFTDVNDVSLMDDRDEDAVNESVDDQSAELDELQATDVNDESVKINYSWFPGGLASDVSCVEDNDCNCVTSDGGYCTTEYTNDDGEVITIKQQQMGRLFKCGENPFSPSATKKFCVAEYRYFNNTGKVNKAFWGGKTSNSCDPGTEDSCSRYGAEYICDAETTNCKSDIRLSFSVEYDLQRLVNVKPGDLSDDENAAVWRAAEYDGEDTGLCLVDSEGKILDEPVILYGLNRCDQIALKEGIGDADVANPLRLKAIDDESVDSSYALYPQAQANYRLMATDFEYDQAKFLAFCNNPSERITHNNIVLDDPIDMSVSCYNDEGEFKKDLLSIEPSMIKLDKLPVRLVYEPDQGYEANATLTEKNFTMKIRNSARSGGEEAYARTVNIKVNENPGGPPIPVCEASKEEPEPLDQIHLDARNSTSPFGEARKPFSYYWEWAPGGKPAHATDVRLIKATSGFDDDPATSVVTGSWSKEGFPKIKFPVGGRYIVRVKVRDVSQVESGPSAECPKCEEWAYCNLNVRPKEKLHVELLWLKGDYVDLDLFLVRERPDGTFSISSAFQDKPDVDDPVMGQCETDRDCQGHFACGDSGFCENACDTNEQCAAINPAWYCNTQKECAVQDSGIIECETDADCGTYFCNPAKIGSAGYKMICTTHPRDSVNDTCYFMNTEPRWGEYETLERGCNGDADCTGGATDIPFTCGAGDVCDFSCTSSLECLTASSEYICDVDAANPVCIGNSLEDDPTLDIDDVDGWGPENISLKEPAPGRYRIVARLYSDKNDVLSADTPNSSVSAYVQIFINGEIALANELSTEFIETGTYWKVADIDWTVEPDPEDSSKVKADGKITPLCAGWTLTECVTNDECKEWFGDSYTCEERNYGDWCSNCIGSTLPQDCDPRATCTNDGECASFGSGYTCVGLTGSFCTCQGSNPYTSFDDNPYANPFISETGGRFIPTDPVDPRSIWCDAPTDKYNDTDSCSTLYQE